MKKKLFLLLFCFMTPFLFGKERDVKDISIEQFLSRAGEYDTQFQVILAERLFLTYRERLAQPAGDFVLNASAAYKLNLASSNSSGIVSSITLSKLFPKSGTSISGSFSVTPKSGSHIFGYGVEVTQSIVRDAFGGTARVMKHIAAIDKDLAHYQVVEAYEDYFATLMVLFYQWFLDRENLETSLAAVKDYGRLLANIQRRKARRIAEAVDVNQAYLQFLDARERVEKAKATLAKTERLISLSTGLSPLQLGKLIPVLKHPEKTFHGEKTLSAFLTISRTARMMNLIERKTDLSVQKAADDLLPSVSLLLGYEHSESIYSTARNDYIYGGVSLKHDFFSIHEKANLGIARAGKRKEILSLKERKRKLVSQVSNLVEDVNLAVKLIELSSKRARVAAAVTAGQRRKFYQARLSLSDLIKSLKDYYERKYAASYYKAQAAMAQTELFRITDRLVVKTSL